MKIFGDEIRPGDRIYYCRKHVSAKYENGWVGVVDSVSETRLIAEFISPSGKPVKKQISKERCRKIDNDDTSRTSS